MSYAMAGALQAAIYEQLKNDTGLQKLIGTAIYDALPDGPLAGTYVVIGEGEARDRSDISGAGALHLPLVVVVSDASGFGEAKAAAARICDVLLGTMPQISRGRVAGIWFDRGKSRRIDAGARRRIDLRFQVRVEDDATTI